MGKKPLKVKAKEPDPHPMLTPEYLDGLKKLADSTPDKPPLSKHNAPDRIFGNKPKPES